MRKAFRHQSVRVTASGGLIALLLAICLRIRHMNDATVALLLVLAVYGIAATWGSAEAVAAALVGGLGFDSYFLPPRGLFVDAPEHMIALAAFAVTALATGQLAARSKQKRMLAERYQKETDQLYRLVNALLDSTDSESAMRELAEKLVEIFNAGGAAIYHMRDEKIVRSGPQTGSISDQALHECATTGRPIQARNAETTSALSVTPIRYAGAIAGSVGIIGAALPAEMLEAIAGRIGLGIARIDETEQITQAEVARRSEELKSAVLDALAHEIRSPLNSMKLAATTLLSERPGGEANQREMLSIINEETDRMDRFIDETLRLTRMQASELSLHKVPENMPLLIQRAVGEMGALTAHRDIEVQVADSLPPAECDKDLLLRVLKLLLDNALKYSPGDSPLKVSAKYSGDSIVLDVIDHGPGVAPAERERIFERYYRGGAARGRSGTGLGLASAKCIMEAHGGEIWVTDAPGGGAAFHITVPASRTSHPVGAR